MNLTGSVNTGFYNDINGEIVFNDVDQSRLASVRSA